MQSATATDVRVEDEKSLSCTFSWCTERVGWRKVGRLSEWAERRWVFVGFVFVEVSFIFFFFRGGLQMGLSLGFVEMGFGFELVKLDFSLESVSGGFQSRVRGGGFNKRWGMVGRQSIRDRT